TPASISFVPYVLFVLFPPAGATTKRSISKIAPAAPSRITHQPSIARERESRFKLSKNLASAFRLARCLLCTLFILLPSARQCGSHLQPFPDTSPKRAQYAPVHPNPAVSP